MKAGYVGPFAMRTYRFVLSLSCAAPAVYAQAREAASCPEVQPIVRALSRDDCGEYPCGVDRWAVKTLTDRDRNTIDFEVRKATVKTLGRLAVPRSRPQARRVGIHERRVYCVEAWLMYAHPQEDGDLHLALLDPEDESSTMIAEIPDQRCTVVCRSPYVGLFAQARGAVERKIATDTTGVLRVLVTGVGFFDKKHGQSDGAPNYFELHPVLAVRFLDVEAAAILPSRLTATTKASVPPPNRR